MPKWVEGYQAAVNDPGLATTSVLTDSNNSTSVEVTKSDEINPAQITAIYDLGASPATVARVDFYVEFTDAYARSLQYSSDGSSWTGVGITGSPPAGTCSYTPDSSSTTGLSIAARYWRFSIKSDILNCIEQKVKISEFRLYDGSNNLLTDVVTTEQRRRGLGVF